MLHAPHAIFISICMLKTLNPSQTFVFFSKLVPLLLPLQRVRIRLRIRIPIVCHCFSWFFFLPRYAVCLKQSIRHFLASRIR